MEGFTNNEGKLRSDYLHVLLSCWHTPAVTSFFLASFPVFEIGSWNGAWLLMPVVLGLKKLSQSRCIVKVSLGYRARPYLKRKRWKRGKEVGKKERGAGQFAAGH